VEFFAEVGAIEQLHRNRLERVLPDGLSAAGFAVLNRLARRGAENPASLATGFQLSKGAITNTLQRLEAAGWISVAGDPADGRRKVASLTAEGQAAHAAAVAALRPLADDLRTAFPANAFSEALPFLAALRAWLHGAP
jgi:DNA-binding MarR family transcriptional regulator